MPPIVRVGRSLAVTCRVPRKLKIKDLYSERAPCQDSCKPAIEQLGYMVNVTWSFRWNGAPGTNAQIRAESDALRKRALKELQLLWNSAK
ncbi:MAG: hypothetical protein SYR96_35760 [Actinomycetota bacterium]|nr:hypothetical protein [Actinomycetota bacterium]